MNWAPGAQAGRVLNWRAPQLTQKEAEQKEPRAGHRRKAEAHHDPEEQAAERAATPRRGSGKRRKTVADHRPQHRESRDWELQRGS